MIAIVEVDRDPLGRDSRLIWAWRNDPVTRQMSRRTEPIAWEDHQAWYARTEARIVMASVDGEPVAMMRFDEIERGHAEININLNPTVRGKGLGASILAAGCAYGFDMLGLDRIRAEVKPENVASIKVFKKAGFTFAGDHEGLRRYELKRG